MASVSLSSVSKRFAANPVLEDVSLDIQAGEFIALLGPSGCGKTTLLRLIAGLERPSSGTIAIGGRIMADPARFVAPEERNLGMVFQSYALWPHMSVRDNVGFGLFVRKVPARERAARINAALDVVGLRTHADRRPHELSGGQRQRVALARCLALEPALILLDEPLANLDANLRASMQAEFRRIHKKTGTTFVFVTHDQAEAMALADRIAVMDKGRIEQVATPQQLYEQPLTSMVAGFVGRGAVVPVRILGHGDKGRLEVDIAGRKLQMPGVNGTARGWLSVRPEHVQICPSPTQDEHIPAIIEHVTYRGGLYEVGLALDHDRQIKLEAQSSHPVAPEARVGIRLTRGWVLPAPDTHSATAS